MVVSETCFDCQCDALLQHDVGRTLCQDTSAMCHHYCKLDTSCSHVLRSQPAVANKRKILKPVNVNFSTSGKHQDILPANMLFGDAFMVPKLRR